MKTTALIASLASLIFLAGCTSPQATPPSDDSVETPTSIETTTITTGTNTNETNNNQNYEEEKADTNSTSNNENESNDENDESTTTKVNTSTSTTNTSTTVTKTYTLTQVAEHASETDCRTVVNGNVYNITSYVPRHPGGVQQIMRVCGTDGTQAFTRKHDGDKKPKDILATFKIGTLAQ